MNASSLYQEILKKKGNLTMSVPKSLPAGEDVEFHRCALSKPYCSPGVSRTHVSLK